MLWHDGYRFIRSRARSAFGNYSPPIRFNCLFELGAGGLEGLIGLPAWQLIPCLSGSCVGGEGHGRLVYIWCYIPAQSSCRSLQAFNL